MSLAEEVNIGRHDAFVDHVPHDMFARLRHEAPVFLHPQAEDDQPADGYWVISRHADVVRANRQWENFSSGLKGAIMVEDRPDLEMARMIIDLDPPEHTRLRTLISRGFTPKIIRSMDGHYREVTKQIVADAVAKGSFDFVSEIAAELPLVAIAELLGLPVEDRHKVFTWSNTMIGNSDPEYGGTPDLAQAAMTELYMYANELAAARTIEPRQDIITVLLSAEGDQQLSEHEFDLFVLLLAVAGNETTRNALAHGMNAFLQFPEQWKKVQSDPEKYLDGAIEEILRWATPVMQFRRTATHDIEMHGVTIPKDAAVMLNYMAANYDETVFPDPHVFDIERSPNPHVAFGGGGPHHCLGVSLARLEMRILFEELLCQVDHFEQLAPADRLRSNFINGIKHLQVRAIPVA